MSELRDENGRRIPDEIERAAMRRAAERDGYIAPRVRDDSWRGVFCRAAGLESRSWVDVEAVNAEAQKRRTAGDAPESLRDQLEIAHAHLNNVVDLTDRGDLHAFQERLNTEAKLAAMGPGSGIAVGEPGGKMTGDPDIIARSQAAEAYKARLAAQAQARLDAEAIKFAGPYRIFNSVA